jgi:L-threonylcarbamoyladenylate synthase
MGKIRIINCLKNDLNAASEAAQILELGGLVALPTETVYGLAAHIHFHEALESIYTLKQRPHSDPLIVHIFDASWILRIASPNRLQLLIANALAQAFWPGPLTLVLECNDRVHPLVRAGGSTVAMRAPAHPFFRSVLEKVGEGIAAPSANVFGHISPTTAEHVVAEFPNSDLTVFDGGPCEVGIESTVVRIEPDGIARVLRPGVITAQQIEALLMQKGLWSSNKPTQSAPAQSESVLSESLHLDADALPDSLEQLSPGLATRHYAPNVPTYVLKIDETDNEKVVGESASIVTFLSGDETLVVNLSTAVVVDFGPPNRTMLRFRESLKGYINPSPAGDLAEYTRGLFSALRQAEAWDGTSVIFIHFSVNNDDRWAGAIRDRINRSASGKSATIVI